MSETTVRPVEDVLLGELARGDAVLGTLAPILRQLLASDGNALFSDEIVARVRGMLGDVAQQLLIAQAEGTDTADTRSFAAGEQARLVAAFCENPVLLGHAHALALEWQLTERLQARNNIDPVLSPLLQSLIASDDPEMAGLAMTVLAAQARFVQSQRRMELPLGELPGDLFHAVLIAMQALAEDSDSGNAAATSERLRSNYNESRSRLGLITRLVVAMGGRASDALAIEGAGAAIFLTALAVGSGQERDLAVLSTSERQLIRLALSLRATGIDPRAVEEQFLYLHPDFALPEGFGQLDPERALALLLSSSPGGED